MSQSGWPTLRTIIYDSAAQAEIDLFTDPSDRFHDQLRAIEWLLSHSPDIGTPRTEKEPCDFLVHIVAGDDMAKTEDVWLVYSYTPDEVIIHGLKVINV